MTAKKKVNKQMVTNKEPDQKGEMKTGVTYVTSWGSIDQSDIDAGTIGKYRNNVYAKGVAKRQRFLIFTDRPTVAVYDPKGESVDELRDKVMAMADRVGLYDNMMVMFDEMFWYGAGLLNPVWVKEGNEVTLQELRHLPSDSFTSPPTGVTTIYSNVMQGLVLDDDGEMEYYQLQDLNSMTPVKLEGNVMMIKDPTEPGLAGSPMVLPLIAVLKMMDFAWDANMQRVNRFGAGGVVFIEVTNGTQTDIDYATKVLKNWGRKTSYVLKDNMKVVPLSITESSSAMETINALNQLLIEFFSPASSLTKEGSLIGGSDWGASELLKSYIGGIHRMLEGFMNSIFQFYLDANGYADHTVEWTMPTLSIDRSEINLKQAQVGFNTKSATLNEIRKLLGLEELDDKGLAALMEQYKQLGTLDPAQGGNPGGNPLDVVPPIMNTGCDSDAWYNAMSNPKLAEKVLRKDAKKGIDQLEEEVMKALGEL